jgi:DNA-directed RNA polymerase sigma subunit (sigma70/sigma32)
MKGNGLSNKAIGEEFGLSGERVRQILTAGCCQPRARHQRAAGGRRLRPS